MFESQRQGVQIFADAHAQCGDVQPSAWMRRGDTVTIEQRCRCGARQSTNVDADIRVQLADGRILPIADPATEMADVVRLHPAA